MKLKTYVSLFEYTEYIPKTQEEEEDMLMWQEYEDRLKMDAGHPSTKKKKKRPSKTMVKCKNCGNTFDFLSVPESGMGYVKCPNCGNAVTQKDIV